MLHMFLSHFCLHTLNITIIWETDVTTFIELKRTHNSITGILLSNNCTNILTDYMCMLFCWAAFWQLLLKEYCVVLFRFHLCQDVWWTQVVRLASCPRRWYHATRTCVSQWQLKLVLGPIAIECVSVVDTISCTSALTSAVFDPTSVSSTTAWYTVRVNTTRCI